MQSNVAPGFRSRDSFDVVVVGGGIIGVATAWRLTALGVSVALFERDEIGAGASRRNAGQIRAGECTPLASPGAIRDTVASLWKRHAPVRILAPPTPSLIRWLWTFARATRSPLGPRRHALARLGHLSEDMVADFVRRHPELDRPEPRGALDVFETSAGMVSAAEEEGVIRSHGFRCELLGADDARSIEPMLTGRTAGALWFPADRCVDPQGLLDALAAEARDAGAELFTGQVVERIVASEGRAPAVVVDGHVVSARTIVLACGHATGRLTRPLGVVTPIRPGKGYTVDVVGASALRVPVVFVERHAAATPLDGRIRLAGGMIVGARRSNVPRGAADALSGSVREVLRGLGDVVAAQPWAGLRPLTPDGLPLIGRLAGMPSLVVAAGHGMLGITYALGTAELVAKICVGSDPEVDTAAFSPDRFARGVG